MDEIIIAVESVLTEIVITVGSGGGGTTVHNELTGRDEPACHPAEAISYGDGTVEEMLFALSGALSGKQDALGFTPENVTNKVTSFQVTPTNTAYPSEKLVKDSLDNTIYSIGIALAQLDADIEFVTGVAKFPFPENATLIEVFIRVSVAPTGSNAIWDINASGSSILTNKITVEAGEFSSLDATTQPSFSDAIVDKGEAITVDCDQIGATIAGQNPVLIINYKKR